MVSDNIEALAEKVLSDNGVTALPVPVEAVALNLRIRISRAPSLDFSGILVRKDGGALIGVNSREAPLRQRFTVAHELGHFFLHKEKDAFVDFRDNKRTGPLSQRERQANMFAAALLMPRKFVEIDARELGRDGLTNDEIVKLAERYEVSIEAMRYRLINLNLTRSSC